MELEHGAWDFCDCPSCRNGGPSLDEVLDARRFFVAIKLPSTDISDQRKAQTSELDAVDDNVDDRACFSPTDSFEVGPIRFTDKQLRLFRCAVELLRLKVPQRTIDVRPVATKPALQGRRRPVDTSESAQCLATTATSSRRSVESLPSPRSSSFTMCVRTARIAAGLTCRRVPTSERALAGRASTVSRARVRSASWGPGVAACGDT